ncbi:Endo-alpha-N-acetylgalactosaminidase [Paenibacillus sp. UNCCL117]|uniref:endo-alpha-N-acetylgalactosaminidase family protein n=1 Tax=unclassified Paenibacillus TaxID=185978 RepID=UPI00088E6DB5|nr:MULTISPECIES: endo-alpha-N-acetylgalactosaminidase family protein [unclassified Paenibacillus]SDC18426.1 Endo-alpha-N-acetylgalactosaminidase [Paenibacillus sp. cl123]SFW18200.1 Endo-alpha-N-acetylgalactosaminidase [Paenibacillus sp. UNCCL117]
MTEDNSGIRLRSIAISTKKTTLRLDEAAWIFVSGTMSDGTEANFTDTVITYACSDPDVLSTVARMGAGAYVRAGTRTDGTATVTVKAVTADGSTVTDSVVFTVIPAPAVPFIHPYHQTLTMKITSCESDGTVRSTFEQSLEVIKKLDHLTRGMPKIIYLVGWQYDGHDTGFPAWDIVNPKLKRAQDATAADSLRWLMNEAFRYHTVVSLHINMLDIKPSSPMWSAYLEHDLIAKNVDGTPKTYLWGTPISYTREWNKGFTQLRIDQLLELLPLQRAGTVHIDAFHQLIPRLEQETISPYHGITLEEEAETQKKIFRYWRERGVDVTSEFDSKFRIDPFLGLQPLAWHFGQLDPMKVPASLYVGGEGGDQRFGVSMLGQKLIQADPIELRGFLDEFCRKTLLWYYLNRLERLSDADGIVTFSEGVISYLDQGKPVVKQGERVLRDGGDLFVPAQWLEQEHAEIIAYSRQGYEDRVWKMPETWRDVEAADVYTITPSGLTAYAQALPVQNGEIALRLQAGQAVSVVPAGTTVR